MAKFWDKLFKGTDPDSARLARIEASLARLLKIGEKIVATEQEFLAVLQRIDTATNKIGTNLLTVKGILEALRDSIKNMGLTAEQEATLLAKVTQAADAVEAQAAASQAIAADPADPAPVPVPVEP